MAFPIPRAAPVTTATRPPKSNGGRLIALARYGGAPFGGVRRRSRQAAAPPGVRRSGGMRECVQEQPISCKRR